MEKVKCACVQHGTDDDVNKNVELASRLIKEAAGNGAKIICLQEIFNRVFWVGDMDQKYYDWAETIPGPTTDKISKVAQETETVIVTPVFEKTVPGENYNAAAVIGPNGDIIGKYRKMSIPRVHFKFEHEGKQVTFAGDEKLYFKPGNLGFPVFDTPFGVKIGILICYDRHFPEAARCLALGGAELMLVPTATGGPAIPIVVAEQKGHAIANGMYIGVANRVGRIISPLYDGPDEPKGGGSSFFLDPAGELICQAGDTENEIIYADIDTSRVAEERNKWGFFRDRRPDAYGALVE